MSAITLEVVRASVEPLAYDQACAFVQAMYREEMQVPELDRKYIAPVLLTAVEGARVLATVGVTPGSAAAPLHTELFAPAAAQAWMSVRAVRDRARIAELGCLAVAAEHRGLVPELLKHTFAYADGVGLVLGLVTMGRHVAPRLSGMRKARPDSVVELGPAIPPPEIAALWGDGYQQMRPRCYGIDIAEAHAFWKAETASSVELGPGLRQILEEAR